jgi:hypothetical protein
VKKARRKHRKQEDVKRTAIRISKGSNGQVASPMSHLSKGFFFERKSQCTPQSSAFKAEALSM